jgi:hypothetical protein
MTDRDSISISQRLFPAQQLNDELLSYAPLQQSRDLGWRVGDRSPCLAQGIDFVFSTAAARPDNRPGVTETVAWRRSAPGDERHYWLAHRGNVLRSLFLRRAADLADQHHAPRGLIGLEKLQNISEASADDWVATDAYCGRLPQTGICQIADYFIGEGRTPPHNANAPLTKNAGRHNA